ncbi:MAG: ATP-binding protein, partial [Myxococcota bacterium]
LNLVVKDTVPFLQALVTPTAELQLDLADTLVEVRADRGGLHQLLVDLVQNAVEASDEIGSPVVVRTGLDKVATGQNLQPRDTLAGRDAVFLEVEDRGHGMNSATVGQAFDPFFSTRGYGRGLGLSVVREVARSHSGAIEVDSQLGRGTRIRVWLPFGRAPKRRSVSSSAERSASRGVVLVADDEPEVRGLLRRILVAGGYQVLEAGDGASTLELVDAHPESRLLILDLTMPRMDGAEVARRLVIRHRTLPVMMMSGYALSKAKTLLAGVEVAGFLKKPFLPGAVLSKVKRILGE